MDYASYIEFTNGFRNTLYMTKEQIDDSSIKSISEEGTINVEYVDNTNEENKIIGNIELATNEEKLELFRQSDLIKFDLIEKASELKIDFNTLTKKDFRILENIIDVETDEKME